jgi:Arc/MetJ-type ribon-helix-helix transcriptional regulator
MCYHAAMATTTVRLSPEEEEALDRLAQRYGGRSGAIRHAVRRLAAEQARQDALQQALDEWEAERGPVDEEAVAAAIRRFGLAR